MLSSCSQLFLHWVHHCDSAKHFATETLDSILDESILAFTKRLFPFCCRVAQHSESKVYFTQQILFVLSACPLKVVTNSIMLWWHVKEPFSFGTDFFLVRQSKPTLICPAEARLRMSRVGSDNLPSWGCKCMGLQKRHTASISAVQKLELIN